MASPEPAVVLELPVRRRPAQAALHSMRPRQWTKNLLLFAGIVFAAELDDPVRWLEAVAAFAAYCAASSAAYLVNDVVDAEHDRAHPVKRARPIALGELSGRSALVLAGALGLAAFALAGLLGRASVLYLAGFLAIQAAYSLRLKHIVLLDVAAIGGLFVIRAAAGADAVDVQISPWLLVCTALLALFLGLAKRRGELVLVGAQETPGRPVLEGYSLALVDRFAGIVAAATVLAYAVYTLTAHSKLMALTIPFVLFGVVRYLVLVHRDDLGEEPEKVLLSDAPILACIALWSIASATILSLT